VRQNDQVELIARLRISPKDWMSLFDPLFHQIHLHIRMRTMMRQLLYWFGLIPRTHWNDIVDEFKPYNRTQLHYSLLSPARACPPTLRINRQRELSHTDWANLPSQGICCNGDEIIRRMTATIVFHQMVTFPPAQTAIIAGFIVPRADWNRRDTLRVHLFTTKCQN
jgi:hypothetical protein